LRRPMSPRAEILRGSYFWSDPHKGSEAAAIAATPTSSGRLALGLTRLGGQSKRKAGSANSRSGSTRWEETGSYLPKLPVCGIRYFRNLNLSRCSL
jgi:hypothetical protein